MSAESEGGPGEVWSLGGYRRASIPRCRSRARAAEAIRGGAGGARSEVEDASPEAPEVEAGELSSGSCGRMVMASKRDRGRCSLKHRPRPRYATRGAP